MKAFASFAASLFLAGCLAPAGTPGSEPDPTRVARDAPPQLPADTFAEGPKAIGRCYLSAAYAFPGARREFEAPPALQSPPSGERASHWRNSTLVVEVSAPNGTRVALVAKPFVNVSTPSPRLAFRIVQEEKVRESDRDFVSQLKYGVWTAWDVRALVAASPDPSLANQGLLADGRSHVTGWLAVQPGGWPSRVDDRLIVYLDGRERTLDPFVRLPLLGGDLFMSGRGICAD